jgi:hypothetical protein
MIAQEYYIEWLYCLQSAITIRYFTLYFILTTKLHVPSTEFYTPSLGCRLIILKYCLYKLFYRLFNEALSNLYVFNPEKDTSTTSMKGMQTADVFSTGPHFISKLFNIF